MQNHLYSTLSPLIQLSLTPVFMLSAIGMTLGLVDTRLNRVVDRVRVLEERIIAHPARLPEFEPELDFFLRRAARIQRAAWLCTLSSMFVALSIVLLFIDGQIETPLALPVETAFICAVLMYGLALAMYLNDVRSVYHGLGFLRRRVARLTGATEPVPPPSGG